MTGENSRNSVFRELITVSKVNETYLKVDGSGGVCQELNEYFSFFAPNYKFMPEFKNKVWDGKIRLYNRLNKTVYCGLFEYVKAFCKERDYDLQYDEQLEISTNCSVNEVKEFAKQLKVPLELRDYQSRAVAHCVRNNRALILSPTASGKSLIIYLLAQFYQEHKTLIVVPTISLVHQMAKDFKDYGYTGQCKLITAGVDKEKIDQQITITTWQSVYNMPKKWFSQFNVVIGDEAHLFKAKSLVSIMVKLEQCKYRFGFTGTLNGANVHKLVLEGLFGLEKNFVTTKDLIDSGTVSDLKIKILVLKYSDQTLQNSKNYSYDDEINFIVQNPRRNKFIANLAKSLSGNSLILYQYVDKQGVLLYDIIQQSINNKRMVFFVHGGTDAETRESVRSITEREQDAIIIASYGTFSTGINIRNIHNIILASPSKSKIRNLQSIGRGLRKSETKTVCTLYDISDDLQYQGRVNHTMRHLYERVKIYSEEQFDYKMYKIKLEK